MNNTTEQTNKQKLLDKMGGDYGYGFINNFSKCDLYIAFDVSVGSTQYFFFVLIRNHEKPNGTKITRNKRTASTVPIVPAHLI